MAPVIKLLPFKKTLTGKKFQKIPTDNEPFFDMWPNVLES
jgi:hypothetical protein